MLYVLKDLVISNDSENSTLSKAKKPFKLCTSAIHGGQVFSSFLVEITTWLVFNLNFRLPSFFIFPAPKFLRFGVI